MRVCVAGLLLFILTGCAIGNGRICGPQTPLVYCDKEAYKKLFHPTPDRDRWKRENGTDAVLNSDWIRCGGRENGWYWASPIPDETYWLRAGKLRLSIEFCMMESGYKYAGDCDSGFLSTFPKCLVGQNIYFSREYWVRSDVSVAGGNKDWSSCGGNDDGRFYLKVPEAGSETEDEAALDRDYYVKQVNEMQRCMLSKRYQYIGECSSAIMRVTPVCLSK